MPLGSCIGATYALRPVGLSNADFGAGYCGPPDPYGWLKRGAARRDLSPTDSHTVINGIHNRIGGQVIRVAASGQGR